jgi:hypothetical protein
MQKENRIQYLDFRCDLTVPTKRINQAIEDHQTGLVPRGPLILIRRNSFTLCCLHESPIAIGLQASELQRSLGLSMQNISLSLIPAILLGCIPSSSIASTRSHDLHLDLQSIALSRTMVLSNKSADSAYFSIQTSIYTSLFLPFESNDAMLFANAADSSNIITFIAVMAQNYVVEPAFSNHTGVTTSLTNAYGFQAYPSP